MLRSILIATLIGAVPAPSSPAHTRMNDAAPDTLGQFPEVAGSNLDGRHVKLPSDFKGELNVLLVAFKREQQADADSWMPFLRTVADSERDLRVYELPTLGRRYLLIRPMIDGGMRRGIPDAAVRAATITLYINKSPFRKSLRLPDEERIYILLVDREGRVFWRAQGRFDEQQRAELARGIETAHSAHAVTRQSAP